MSSLKNEEKIEEVTGESIKEEMSTENSLLVYGLSFMFTSALFLSHLYHLIVFRGEGAFNSGIVTIAYLTLGIFSILSAISFFAGMNENRNFKRHVLLTKKIDEVKED